MKTVHVLLNVLLLSWGMVFYCSAADNQRTMKDFAKKLLHGEISEEKLSKLTDENLNILSKELNALRQKDSYLPSGRLANFILGAAYFSCFVGASIAFFEVKSPQIHWMIRDSAGLMVAVALSALVSVPLDLICEDCYFARYDRLNDKIRSLRSIKNNSCDF